MANVFKFFIFIESYQILDQCVRVLELHIRTNLSKHLQKNSECMLSELKIIYDTRARDMVVEQRGHFWGVQGRSLWWGLGDEAPGKFLGL